MITEGNWSYVGDGHGDSVASGGFQYVGLGAGPYKKEVMVTPYGCKLRPSCICLSLLLAVPLLFFLFYMRSQSAPTPSPAPLPPPPPIRIPVPLPAPPPPAPPPPSPPAPAFGAVGACTVWGDPHVITFDGLRADYYSPGEYWIVKSSDVHIQGRYLPTRVTSGLAVTKIVAIGGPLLKGHKLFVGPRTAFWDSTPVLQTFPGNFSVNGLLQMHLDDVGELLQKGRAGLTKRIVHINIVDGSTEGLQVQVNRWTQPTEGDYVNVKITMHQRPDQDGHCGNFNGDSADDDRLKVRARIGTSGVPEGDLLFNTKTPVVAANRPNINDCPAIKLDEAKAYCRAKEGGKLIPSMACLVDYCFAGKGFAATR